MTNRVKEVIARALYEWSGSGQGVDDMLAEIAMAQSDAILAALEAAGYVVVERAVIDALVVALEKAKPYVAAYESEHMSNVALEVLLNADAALALARKKG